MGAEHEDNLVDAFVAYLNAAGFEPKFQNEVPEELRTSAADYDTFNWQIRAALLNAWVEELDQKLPERWPKAFTALIQRYRFCNFEVGPLMLFANSGHQLFYELSDRTFKGKGIFPRCTKMAFFNSACHMKRITTRSVSI